MLLALTTNPAIDRTLVVPGFRHGEVTRVTEKRDAAGGKGLNVARVAHRLGYPVRACGPLGGYTGRDIADLTAAEAIEGAWFWMQQGASRVCLLISDLATQDSLVINEPGPPMHPNDWQGFAAFVQQQAGSAAAVSFSGSLMPGVSMDAYRSLVQALLQDGRAVYVDISGEPLRATLDLPIALLKVNTHELGAALGRSISGPAEAIAAAQYVCAQPSGPRMVVVTLGAAGAIACDEQGVWHAQTPPIQLVSPVGSGDSVLAGMAVELLQGASSDQALLTGVAAGAANAQTLGGGNIDPAEVQRLVLVGRVERVSG